MSSTVRTQILNRNKTQTGSIQEEMKAYALQPIPNDGINVYGNVRINPTTAAPYSDSQEINISLCSQNFDITEFDNSYIHLKLRLRMRFDNAPQIDTSDAFGRAIAENQFVFIGLKASPHCIRNYSFKFNEVPITTSMQSSAITESFLYTTLMGKSERANKKYVFSPYDEVRSLDNSTCGVFVPIKDLTTGSYQTMDVIIPYKSLLALSGWNEYPNSIFGELKIVFTISREAFVYTEVSPITSLKKGILSGKIDKSTAHISDALACVDDTFNYVHAFDQCSIPSAVQFISGYNSDNGKLTFSTQPEFCPYVDEIVCTEAWVDCKGYRVKDSALQNLRDFFRTNPFTVCAQKVETYSFPSGPEASGLRTCMNVRFNHTTDAVMLFPKDSRQRTVFTNIGYDNLQLQVGNRRFPEQLISTISPQFHEIQIQSSDFDSIFEASDELEHSWTDVRTDGTNKLNPCTDDTNFMVLYQFERSGGGGSENSMWFDGIDSPNEKVELTGRPLYPNSDVYFTSTANSTIPPILCLDTETYWIMRLDASGRPQCQYVTAHEYEEAFHNKDLERM